jgi:hypothetical protein
MILPPKLHFLTKIEQPFLTLPLTHPNLPFPISPPFELIKQNIFGEKYQILTSDLHNFLHLNINSTALGPNVFSFHGKKPQFIIIGKLPIIVYR